MKMRFRLKGIQIGNLVITTRKQLENMPIQLDINDLRRIVKRLKEDEDEVHK